jgi:hypothetical protein
VQDSHVLVELTVVPAQGGSAAAILAVLARGGSAYLLPTYGRVD